MALPIGQKFKVLVDGKFLDAEITAVRNPDPANGIKNYLIETRFCGMPDLLPMLDIAGDEWQYLNVFELESRYREILSGKQTMRSQAVSY